jgi:hypothetical protein
MIQAKSFLREGLKPKAETRAQFQESPARDTLEYNAALRRLKFLCEGAPEGTDSDRTAG